MGMLIGFLTSLALSIVLALSVTRVLSRPLGELLVELCGNARRARFWAAFSSVALVLGSMLGALFSIPGESRTAWEGAAGLRTMLVGMRSSLFLLLAVIAVLGFVMLSGISRAAEAGARRERKKAGG